MQQYYAILGLDESATDEQVEARYLELKKKYSEDRWLEGEAGNEAARMLGSVETAYYEICAARRARGNNGQNLLNEAAENIKRGDFVAAQKNLDDCNERTAEWHFLQSFLFYRKNWINESKKQLEIAMQMDPSNPKYRDAYQKMEQRTQYSQQSGYQDGGQTAQVPPQDQMGGSGCSQCLECCYTYLCINCIFNLCCGCR